MYPKGNLLIDASHGRLEAILKEPRGDVKGVALVCHPHPLGGGTRHKKGGDRAAAAGSPAPCASSRKDQCCKLNSA